MNMRVSMRVVMAVAVSALLGGCFGSSPSSRFYTLASGEVREIPSSERMEALVRVGPVSMPSYLDRRQIVTRNGLNGIEIAEYERWGGSLDEEIIRVLVNDLSVRLADRGIYVAPWSSVSLAEAPVVYRIPLGIYRFDGIPGEVAVLETTWAVVMKKEKLEKVIVARESTIIEMVARKDYDALVAAMGKTVERLGNEIAVCLSAITREKGLK